MRYWAMHTVGVGIMCDFPDTDLLYRDAGGEQRKLIDQAKRLYDRLDDLTSTRDTPDTTYYRLS